MRFLTSADVRHLIKTSEAIDLMRILFAEVGRGAIDQPERVVIGLNGTRDSVLFMPGYLSGLGQLGVKIVTVFPENPRLHDLPTVNALIVVFDQHTGCVTAIMDGTYITALRTGAVSGLATMLLAREDAHVLAIFGAGAQARTQIDAIMQIRRITSILVCDPAAERAASLSQELNGLYGAGCCATVSTCPDEAVAAADIVVTATTSTTPVFDGARLRPGTHINAIGSFKPSVCELDETTMTRARIFVDDRRSVLREAGDLLVPIERGVLSPSDVQADLGELVLGQKAGRLDERDVTVFKSVGLAVEDIIVATRVLEYARAADVGMVFDEASLAAGSRVQSVPAGGEANL